MNRFDFVTINGEEYQVIEPDTGKVYHVATNQRIVFGDLRNRVRLVKAQAQTQWWEIIPVAKSATPRLDARAVLHFNLYSPWGFGL